MKKKDASTKTATCFCHALTPSFVVFSLRKIRSLVWKARLTSPLFSTDQYARDLEVVYRRMWAKYEEDRGFDHLTEPVN